MICFEAYTKYYYNKLNSSEQKIYMDILVNCSKMKNSFRVFTFNSDANINQVINAIMKDNPALYFVDFSRISYIKKIGDIAFQVEYKYSYEEKEKYDSLLKKAIYDFEHGFSDNRISQEHIHTFLVNNVEYNNNPNDTYSYDIIGSLVKKSSVCEGYAKAYKFLCDYYKIPCTVVTGTAINQNGIKENHAWNIVRINKKNYHVDSTWDSCLRSINCQLYFNVSDDLISKNHFWDRTFFPKCIHQGQTEKAIVTVSGMNELFKAISNRADCKEKEIIVGFNRKFQSSSDLCSRISKIVEKYNTNSSGCIRRYTVNYINNLDCAILTFDY